jgi:hypothetical protein
MGVLLTVAQGELDDAIMMSALCLRSAGGIAGAAHLWLPVFSMPLRDKLAGLHAMRDGHVQSLMQYGAKASGRKVLPGADTPFLD